MKTAKLKEQARKHEQKEEWERAIQLYQQVLEAHGEEAGGAEADLSLYNRVGDLFLRMGSPAQAVRYYEEAADKYSEAGFFNNAIALCNKALRYLPNRPELYQKLGRLSAEQGFFTDARRWFLEYAERQARAGNQAESFAALEEFATLSNDADVWTMLGRQLLAHEQPEDAAAALGRAYRLHVDAGDAAAAAELKAELEAIDPAAAAAAGAEASPAGGAEEDDLPGLTLAGEEDEGERVVVGGGDLGLEPTTFGEDYGTVEADGGGGLDIEHGADMAGAGAEGDMDVSGMSGLETFTEFEGTSVEEEEEDKDEDEGAPLPMLKAFPDDEPATPLPGFDEEVEEGEPLPGFEVEGPGEEEGEPLAAAAGEEDGESPTGLTLDEPLPLTEEEDAETFAGLEAEEGEEAESEVGAPSALDESEPLPGLMEEGAEEPFAGLFEQEEGEEAEEAQEVEEAEEPFAGLVEPEQEEAEEPFAGLAEQEETGEPLPVPSEQEDAEEAPLRGWGEEEEAAVDAPLGTDEEAALAPAASHDEAPEDTEVLDPGLLTFDAGEESATEEPAEAMLDADVLSFGSAGAAEVEAPAEDSEFAGAMDMGDLDFGGFGAPVEEQAAEDAEEEPAAAPGDARSADVVPAAPSGGVAHVAVSDKPEVLHRAQYLAERGQVEEALEKLEELATSLADAGRLEEALEITDEMEKMAPEDIRAFNLRVEYAFREGDQELLVSAYLALADQLSRFGSAVKARTIYQRVLDLEPTNKRAATALGQEPEKPQPRSAPVGEQYVDLAGLIEGDALSETTRFVVEEDTPTGDEDKDFADMLAQFKSKVSEHVSVEDTASHYDLGLAFKEMGLIDEAIAEFQVALRYGRDRLKVYEELGQCFMAKGQYNVAVKVLSQAVSQPHGHDGDLLGVFYHLGRCYEELGRTQDAKDAYEQVMSIDVAFRDVNERIAKL